MRRRSYTHREAPDKFRDVFGFDFFVIGQIRQDILSWSRCRSTSQTHPLLLHRCSLSYYLSDRETDDWCRHRNESGSFYAIIRHGFFFVFLPCLPRPKCSSIPIFQPACSGSREKTHSAKSRSLSQEASARGQPPQSQKPPRSCMPGCDTADTNGS